MNYRFEEKRHLHQLEINGEWKNLTGCTTILQVVAKPALIAWSARVATEYIKNNINKVNLLTFEKDLGQLLDEARIAHTKRKTEAGESGKKIHEIIEQIIKKAIIKTKGKIKKKKSANKSIQNFLDWAIKNKVKFLESEKNIYSEKLFIGGIVDFVCEIDNKVWIGDIKTSKSGIYPEHLFQTAGYGLMMKEMKVCENFYGYLILNLKENGEMFEKRSISIEEGEDAFLACLKIYRVLEKFKSQVIG